MRVGRLSPWISRRSTRSRSGRSVWSASFPFGKALSDAPARVIRTVFPIVAVLTLVMFGVFVAIARHNAHV